MHRTKAVVTLPRILFAHLRNVRTYHSVRSPFATLWIDPADVGLKALAAYQETPPGTILSGDWDTQVITLDESLKYRGMIEHFEMGLPWEETCLFQTRYLDRLNRLGTAVGMHDIDELLEYYRGHIDTLYRNIAKNGFQHGSWRTGVDPVYVHLGRNGEFIWGSGGNHRLAIARVLELSRIPVRIHLRHEQWQHYRDAVARGVAEVPPELRTHPDLSDVLAASERLTAKRLER